MKFTDLFVHRPVLASVVSLLILLVGLRAIACWKCASTRKPAIPWSPSPPATRAPAASW